MRSPEGQDAYGLATYERIVEPSLIAYTDAFADADRTVDGTMPVMPITVQFTEANGRTTLTSRTLFASAEDVEKVVAGGMEEGLTQTWDRLEAHLAAGRPGQTISGAPPGHPGGAPPTIRLPGQHEVP